MSFVGFLFLTVTRKGLNGGHSESGLSGTSEKE